MGVWKRLLLSSPSSPVVRDQVPLIWPQTANELIELLRRICVALFPRGGGRGGQGGLGGDEGHDRRAAQVARVGVVQGLQSSSGTQSVWRSEEHLHRRKRELTC